MLTTRSALKGLASGLLIAGALFGIMWHCKSHNYTAFVGFGFFVLLVCGLHSMRNQFERWFPLERADEFELVETTPPPPRGNVSRDRRKMRVLTDDDPALMALYDGLKEAA